MDQNGKSKIESAMERAKILPKPTLGVKVSVPLELVPVYLALHGLKPVNWFDSSDTLKVKRLDIGESGGWHEGSE